MTRQFSIRARVLVRVAAPVLLAASLGACAAIPDWVDPTTWFGSDDQATADQSADTDTGAQADNGQGPPDLASIPPKPAAPSTPEEQKQVADSLAADRADAHYSADALRGGTEPAAPPPPPPSATPPETTAAATPPAGSDEAAPAAETADNGGAAAPAAPEAPPAGQTTDAAPPPAPENQKVASTSGQQVTQPVSETPAMGAAQASAGAAPESASADMTAGFAPSKAPALDPSVSQYVPAQVLTRYRETAAQDEAPGVSDEGVAPSRRHRHRKKMKPAAAPDAAPSP